MNNTSNYVVTCGYCCIPMVIVFHRVYVFGIASTEADMFPADVAVGREYRCPACSRVVTVAEPTTAPGSAHPGNLKKTLYGLLMEKNTQVRFRSVDGYNVMTLEAAGYIAKRGPLYSRESERVKRLLQYLLE